MIIPLDDGWRLKTDKYQYKLQKFTTHSGWENEAYYPSISGAVQECYERRLRASEAETLAEVVAESKRLLQGLSGALRVDYDISVTPKSGAKVPKPVRALGSV